jgi:hypothetical protein
MPWCSDTRTSLYIYTHIYVYILYVDQPKRELFLSAVRSRLQFSEIRASSVSWTRILGPEDEGSNIIRNVGINIYQPTRRNIPENMQIFLMSQ